MKKKTEAIPWEADYRKAVEAQAERILEAVGAALAEVPYVHPGDQVSIQFDFVSCYGKPGSSRNPAIANGTMFLSLRGVDGDVLSERESARLDGMNLDALHAFLKANGLGMSVNMGTLRCKSPGLYKVFFSFQYKTDFDLDKWWSRHNREIEIRKENSNEDLCAVG